MTDSLQPHLYGARLEGIHPAQDFLIHPLKEQRLQIVHVGQTDYSPIFIALAENNDTAYSLKVRDAASSAELLSKLNQKDREALKQLALLDPPKPDYSKWKWEAV